MSILNNIIGHWKLDEDSGPIAYDSTSNGNDGAITGTSVEKGLLGNARVFYPNSKDRIEMAENNLFKFQDKDFTVSAWFKRNNVPTSIQSILSIWEGSTNNKSWRLIIDTDGTLGFQVSSNGSAAISLLDIPFVVSDDEWHLASVTRAGAWYRLYVDGARLDQNIFGPESIFSSTAPLVIGNQSDSSEWDGAFDGYIDNVRVYNYQLTDVEENDLFYDTGYDAFPPYFYAVSPQEGEESVSIDTEVVFRYIDESPNLDTLNVTFNGNVVITSGVAEDGYFAVAEHITTVYSDGYDGYEITIYPENPLPERSNIVVEIDAADAYGSFGAHSYDFWTSSSYDPPPSFDNLNPLPGALGVDPGENIFFQFNDGYFVGIDLISGAKLSSLQVSVNGLSAVVNGNMQSGYSGSIVANAFDGFNVTISKDGGWGAGRALNISADGEDNNGTGKSLSYIVKVGAGPAIVDATPAHDSNTVNRYEGITFKIFDAIFGINKGDLNVDVEGGPAIASGVGVNGYSIFYTELQDGYSIIIGHDQWPEYAYIPVEISVRNRVNELATYDYYFYTVDDAGPTIYPVLPSSGAERFNVFEDIVFNVTDPGSGPDPESIWYKLNGEYIVENSMAVQGYYISMNMIDDGYEVVIDRDSPWPDLQRFEAVVGLVDARGNPSTTTYYFSTDDSTIPSIMNIVPEPGGFASGDDHITFSIHDSGGSGVLPRLVSVTIDDAPAIVNGAFQDGFSGSILSSDVDGYDGYDVAIVPDNYFRYGERVSIDVNVKDAYGNANNLEYSFLIHDIDGPIISYLNPDDGSVAPLRPYIRFKIWEPGGIGVDISRLQMTVDGDQAIVDGEMAPHFGGAIEATLVDGGDGYNVWARLDRRFESETIHEVVIDGYDYLGQHSQRVYSFITTFDVTPPTFSGFIPEPDQIDVARTTSIFFQFNDDDLGTYFSNIWTLGAVIDGVQALEGGKPVNGYSALLEENDKDGYDVTLYPPYSFPESYWVMVELDGYDEADNQSSYTYLFRTLEEPGLANFDPYPGQQRVPTDTIVSFDFTDVSSGPDIDSLRVVINDILIVESGIAIGGNAITAVQIADGYRVSVELANKFEEFSIASVEIDGYDLDETKRQDHVYYEFSTDDESAPIITNEWPEIGSTGASLYTEVLFDVYDWHVAVDTSSANIQIDDRDVIIAGELQPNWVVVISPTTVDGYIGYNYRIIPDRAFALDSDISIDIDIADAYGNELSTSYSFRTYKDILAPEIVGFDPIPDSIEVARDKDIEFSIIDGYDVDIRNLNVHVDNNPAILGGELQSGFGGIIYEIADGYRVIIDPVEKYPFNAQITVVIDGYDFSLNHIGYEYYFYTISDTDSPLISNKVPDADDIEVSIRSDIRFDITDMVSGVDGSRLNVHFDSTPAIVGGIVQPGFDGPATGIQAIADGYRIEIDPTGIYELTYNQVRVITVDGYDFAGNHTHDDYSFATIADPLAPILNNLNPSIDEEEVPIYTNISFDVTDLVAGVDMTKLIVLVNGIVAVNNGYITAPFSDVDSSISTIVDGYRVVLDLIGKLDFNELESVYIGAYDFADNLVELSYSFRTKVDVNGPVITPIDPLNSVGGYSRDTNITVRITDDETGVDFESISVVIDNALAVEMGEFTPQFSGAYSNIIQLLDGYELTIDPILSFDPSKEVRVVIDGYDLVNNQTHFEYIFSVRDDVGPYVFDFHPVPGSVDVAVQPLNISFGIRDSGDGEVRLSTLVVEASEGLGAPYQILYDAIDEFRSGWNGNIINQTDNDGYAFFATKSGSIDSFSVYTFKITASDNYGNVSTTIVGKESEFVGNGIGTISGFDRFDVGQSFIEDAGIESNDFVVINGVGAFVIDGYDGDDLIVNKQIPAGGAREFSISRGSFMTERNLFVVSAEATAERYVDTTYTDPYSTIGTPVLYTVSGGDYPLTVVSVESLDDYTIRLATDLPMQPLVEYVLYIDPTAVLDEFDFSIDDGYNLVTFSGYTDRIGPRVAGAFVGPFNVNVTVLFDDYMLQDEYLRNPASYRLSHGAYATDVEYSASDLDRVILTVENLYGREEFDLFVDGRLRDAFGNYLDTIYNHAAIRFEETGASFSGMTGKLKTRDAVNRLYEDSEYWYVATSGGLDVIEKYSMENVGYVLDAYGVTTITATDNHIYFNGSDGYIYDAYQTGVFMLAFSDLNGDSSDKVVDAFAYPTIQSNLINDLFRGTNVSDDVIVVATDNGATVFINDSIIKYSSGFNIGTAYLNSGGTTLYLGNNTLGRVEVYYNIHNRTSDTMDPDVYYDTNTSPEICDSYINQIKIVNKASIIDPDSNVIYVATNNGLTKIDTDESQPGFSESGGISFSYGIDGSGAVFEILGGPTNKVVAVDINMLILQLFVITNDEVGQGGLTTINIPSNKQFSYKSAEYGTLISSDLRDLTFKNL